MGFNREYLPILVFGGFATINEVFEHGQSIASDINNCEIKMSRKVEVEPTASLQRELRGKTPRERWLHRLHSVVLVLSGRSASEAGAIYGDSPRAVAYWVSRFKEKGTAGLEEDQRPGRPTKLNEEQTRELQVFLKRARQQSRRITAKALRDFIISKFRIRLTVRQCWRIQNKFNS
ncbi:MAG TPA: helix-turn-helix domain-containing protein [Verrucomicrobiae bacterium]|nr:helix-turn-helix domain-containing protein [Verrucomicrobiae bacterium]